METASDNILTPDAFIEAAIKLGAQNGVASLDPDQRLVFLISEAEVYCNMDGVDAFLDHYRQDWLSEAAEAFHAVGAVEIAVGLRSINADTQHDDPLLEQINTLITNCAGYDYEAIRRVIEDRLSKRGY